MYFLCPFLSSSTKIEMIMMIMAVIFYKEFYQQNSLQVRNSKQESSYCLSFADTSIYFIAVFLVFEEHIPLLSIYIPFIVMYVRYFGVVHMVHGTGYKITMSRRNSQSLVMTLNMLMLLPTGSYISNNKIVQQKIHFMIVK